MVGEYIFQGDKVSWDYKAQVHKTEKAYAFLALDPPRGWCSCNGSSIKLPVCCWKIWRPCRKACSMAGNSKLNKRCGQWLMEHGLVLMAKPGNEVNTCEHVLPSFAFSMSFALLEPYIHVDEYQRITSRLHLVTCHISRGTFRCLIHFTLAALNGWLMWVPVCLHRPCQLRQSLQHSSGRHE